MGKVNYKVLRVEDSGIFNAEIDEKKLEKHLNKLGQEGWDLVNALDVKRTNGKTEELLMILKQYEHDEPLE